MNALRDFLKQVKSQSNSGPALPALASANQGVTASGDAPADDDAKKPPAKSPDAKASPKKDPWQLRFPDAVRVSADSGTTGEAFPKAGIDYDFYLYVVNTGKFPSGPFFVRFELTGDQEWADDFDEEDGLQPGEKVMAIVNFGKFSNGKYRLNVNIYKEGEPDKAIHHTEFGFDIPPK